MRGRVMDFGLQIRLAVSSIESFGMKIEEGGTFL